jgi:hypothetical protein
MSIKAIIFSFDRALQVDATLHSFYMHCQDAEQVDMYVLYRVSSDRHEAQYQSLRLAYPQVSFVREINFHNELRGILLSFYRSNLQRKIFEFVEVVNSLQFQENSNTPWLINKFKKLGRRLLSLRAPDPGSDKYALFMVDDNLFVRDFNLASVVTALQSFTDAIGFSLRLGNNTTFCYSHNATQPIPPHEKVGDRMFMHEWGSAQYDFNYPLEVSSSVYRASQIMPFLATIPYANPNTLEGEMAARSRQFIKKFSKLLWFETSVAFCNPVNKVQDVVPYNRAALTHYYTVEELAQRFDMGERIDVEFYNGFTPNACHQELELKFVSIK